MQQSQQLKVGSTDSRILYTKNSEIKKALGYVFILLGLNETQIPNELAEEVLMNYVRNSYPNITIDDIKNAFEGAMANKFLLDSKVSINDMKLYGSAFSAEYFSKIVNAYIIYKRSQPVRQNPLDASKQLAEENSMTDEQRKAERIKSQDNILKFYEEHMRTHGKLPIVIDTSGLWAAIKRKGSFDLSEDKIAEVKVLAEERLMYEVNRLNITGRRHDAKKLSDNFQEEVRYEMKKIYVEEYLNELI